MKILLPTKKNYSAPKKVNFFTYSILCQLVLFIPSYLFSQIPISNIVTKFEQINDGNTYVSGPSPLGAPTFPFNLSTRQFNYKFGSDATTNPLGNIQSLTHYTNNIGTFAVARGLNTKALFRKSGTVSGGFASRDIIFYKGSHSVINNELYDIDLWSNYEPNSALAFSGNNFLIGADNVFTNVTSAVNNNNNERIDIIIEGGINISNPAQFGIPIFDRGVGDNFKIGIITSIDNNEMPTSYSNILTVTTNWSPAALIPEDVNFPYYVMRRENADPLKGNTTVTQAVYGVSFMLSQFGINANEAIYGYSIFPDDYSGSTNAGSSEPLDYTNTTFYPRNTNEGGGLDPMGVLVFASLPLSVSGSVWIDANGNGVVNGSEPVYSNNNIFVYLVDDFGNIAGKSSVNASGNYTLSGMPVSTDGYYLKISSDDIAIGSPASLLVNGLPSGWSNASESNNGVIELDMSANGIIDLIGGFDNFTNRSFGVQMIPTINPVVDILNFQPEWGVPITLNGAGNNPSAPSGTDVEDGNMGGTVNNSTFIITTLPDNGDIFYDFGAGPVALTNNTSIPNFNPSNLTLVPNVTGSTSITFQYSFIDNAGAMGTPVDYTIEWAEVLPVTFGEFYVSNAGNKSVLLHWVTHTEINNNLFEIEHSVDGISWNKIGVINSKSIEGNSLNKVYYQFEHLKPSKGKNNYRLKQIDIDGKETYSVIISHHFNSVDVKISVGPNPVRDKLTLYGLSGGEEIILIDNYGKMLLTQKSTSTTHEISMSRYLKGVYYIKVKDKNGQQQIIRVIKD